MENVPGTLYLIHFERRLGHAAHYLGWTTEGRLEARLQEHARGRGSRLLRAVGAAGIGWVLAHTWEGVTRHFERRLKNNGSLVRICPVCKQERRPERVAQRYSARPPACSVAIQRARATCTRAGALLYSDTARDVAVLYARLYVAVQRARTRAT